MLEIPELVFQASWDLDVISSVYLMLFLSLIRVREYLFSPIFHPHWNFCTFVEHISKEISPIHVGKSGAIYSAACCHFCPFKPLTGLILPMHSRTSSNLVSRCISVVAIKQSGHFLWSLSEPPCFLTKKSKRKQTEILKPRQKPPQTPPPKKKQRQRKYANII